MQRRGFSFLLRATIAAVVLFGAGVSQAEAQPQASKLRQTLDEDRGRVALKQDEGLLVTMTHDVKPFGKTNDGQEVKVHTLTNLKGMRVKLIDYGATLISVETPDKNGKMANVTLGFPNIDGYLQRHPYLGS